jgi:arylsulfatase
MSSLPTRRTALALLLASLSWSPAAAQGSALNRAVRVAPNHEPAIPRPEQEAAAEAKLAARLEASGRRPNIVWLVVDDMGYGDPGCYGGGAAVGAATPNMDRLARGGARHHDH